MRDGWIRDIVHGFRSLIKNPVLSLTAVLTLTLGIGANTAIFTLLYGLLLRSLPIPDAYHLVKVGVASAAEPDSEQNSSFMPYRMLQALRERQSSFRDLSAWDGDQVLMKDKDGAVRGYFAVTVSGNAFDLLGVQPYRGRLIATYDDVRGGPQSGWPVVLSYGFWNEFYNRDPNIVGKQIKISDVPAIIVGVTPPDFHGVWPGNEPKMYMPVQIETALNKKPDLLDAPDSMFGVSVIGRLKSDSTLPQANAELKLLQKDLFAQFIPAKFQHIPYIEKAYLAAGFARTGLPTYVSRTYSKPLYLMQGLVGVVLLLCCVNIGGLMMSRIAIRQRECAVRTALGASSWRLLRQYLIESFIIAIVGSSVGAIAAWYGSSFLLHFFRDPMMFESMSIHPDKAIFWMTVLFAVLTTLLFGTLPAWRAARTDPGLLLKSRTGTSDRRQIAGRLFVPVQLAMSLALIVPASLLSQSVIRLRTEATGFDLDHVTIQTSPLYLLEKKGEAKLDLYQRMVDRLMEMPAVDAAAATSQTPMTGEKITADFVAVTEGSSPPEDSQMPYNDVGPGYFRTMKTRIIAGREFEKNDRQLNVCILNQSAAVFFFPNQQPLGHYVRSRKSNEFPDEITCRVVGLAEDAKFYDLRQAPPRTIYLPLSTQRIDNLGNLVFLIHTPTKAQAITVFRKTISEIAPTVPLVIFVTLREQMDAALGSQELITLLANFFGVLALLLSALGLYALLSTSLAQRTGEIGVRMALGAMRGTVIRMVLKEALQLLAWGVMLGSVAMFFTVRFTVAMLHRVSAYDPPTLVAVIGTLVIITLLAALVPAFRAATLDPIEALRAE
ncbi:MAG TPA: ADOP family duplicated permease [Candidatus Sulfotelmatobacter sp.]|nr:ADOP family duplicated permease [Candidatus Sulfotelmatobacter sp.]